MKDTPLLMCAEMIRQTLALVKTQTRRVVKPQPVLREREGMDPVWDWAARKGVLYTSQNMMWHPITNAFEDFIEGGYCPYGKPGDRLWIKETFYQWGKWVTDGLTESGRTRWRFKAVGKKVAHAAEVDLMSTVHRETVGWHKRPAIFMPRWASRITLEITDVRVERVNDISESDAEAEGVNVEGVAGGINIHRAGFSTLWDSINGEKYPWKDNCWVWVISFKLCKTSVNLNQ